jgi:hypothetical protein
MKCTRLNARRRLIRAAHLRTLIAAAPLRQRYLIAVNVHSGVGIGPLPTNVVFTRPLPFHMFSSRPMAPLARNPQHIPAFSVDILRRRRTHPRKIRRVAFQASRNDRPLEIRGAVDESRTVYPLVQLRPIRHRQLKKLIASPVQMRLASFPGAGNEVNSLRARLLVRWLPEHHRLVEAVCPCVHAEVQVGIARLQNIFAASKFARDGFFAGVVATSGGDSCARKYPQLLGDIAGKRHRRQSRLEHPLFFPCRCSRGSSSPRWLLRSNRTGCRDPANQQYSRSNYARP